MPKRASKPQRPTRGEHESEDHFQERLRRFEGREPAPAKSSAPGIQKRARSTQSKIQKKNFALTKNLTQQPDGTLLDVTTLPPAKSEAGKILRSFHIPSYGDTIINDPTRSKDFKPEYARGGKFTTLDEGIERYGSTARHIIPFTKFYQDGNGYWHPYVEIDSP